MGDLYLKSDSIPRVGRCQGSDEGPRSTIGAARTCLAAGTARGRCRRTADARICRYRLQPRLGRPTMAMCGSADSCGTDPRTVTLAGAGTRSGARTPPQGQQDSDRQGRELVEQPRQRADPEQFVAALDRVIDQGAGIQRHSLERLSVFPTRSPQWSVAILEPRVPRSLERPRRGTGFPGSCQGRTVDWMSSSTPRIGQGFLAQRLRRTGPPDHPVAVLFKMALTARETRLELLEDRIPAPKGHDVKGEKLFVGGDPRALAAALPADSTTTFTSGTACGH